MVVDEKDFENYFYGDTITQKIIDEAYLYFEVLKEYDAKLLAVESTRRYGGRSDVVKAKAEYKQSMLYIEMLLLNNLAVKDNSYVSNQLLSSLKTSNPVRSTSIDSLIYSMKSGNSRVSDRFNQMDWENDSTIVSLVADLFPGIGDIKGIAEGLQVKILLLMSHLHGGKEH